jgi:PAS domain S-box-containing protein
VVPEGAGASGSQSLDVTLPPQPPSVAEARQRVRDLLLGCGREDLLDTAVLLVSELVTNALLHAATDIGVTARLDGEGLHVGVSDGSRHLPSRREYGPTSGTGRGLLMLESMVDEWGVSQRRDGKTVWFRLAVAHDHPHAPGPVENVAPQRLRSREKTVPVELRNMPLLLHAAWQEHAEALLREYLLVGLESEDADPIQVHADATDAIAVLEEYVPRAPVPMEPDRIMGDAIEPRVSASRLEVPVPLESVSHFETLDRAIEAALDLSEDGLVLTPPTQPEVQAFRRWLVRQVLDQARGGAAEPWSVPEDHEPLAEPLEWVPESVSDADHPTIAADHANRILAVSRPAADILGYDDPSDLVGERIVTIVPERYRQAHVAGFTMYLLVGRRPLIDSPVVVPALRRDGSEVDVVLLVHEQAVAPGRSVLVADLRLAED